MWAIKYVTHVQTIVINCMQNNISVQWYDLSFVLHEPCYINNCTYIISNHRHSLWAQVFTKQSEYIEHAFSYPYGKTWSSHCSHCEVWRQSIHFPFFSAQPDQYGEGFHDGKYKWFVRDMTHRVMVMNDMMSIW